MLYQTSCSCQIYTQQITFKPFQTKCSGCPRHGRYLISTRLAAFILHRSMITNRLYTVVDYKS